MFRPIRRTRQTLSLEENIEILKRNSYGVLSVNGDFGYPYGVPLNYVYLDGEIYLHCAKEGHKIDSIKNDDKISLCVVDSDEIVKEEYTTYFRSVIIFGRAEIITDPAEFRNSIESFATHFFKEDSRENMLSHVEKSISNLLMLKIKIEHMSGKEAIELVRLKNKI